MIKVGRPKRVKSVGKCMIFKLYWAWIKRKSAIRPIQKKGHALSIKMENENMEKYIAILTERFGKDSLMALATIDENGKPWVRTIDAIFYEDSFYTITYALSNKMKHINENPNVAICGDWFSGHAIGENLGHIKSEENKGIADKLRTAFSAWYDNGHTNEDDPNTVILKMKLSDGILFSDGVRYVF